MVSPRSSGPRSSPESPGAQGAQGAAGEGPAKRVLRLRLEELSVGDAVVLRPDAWASSHAGAARVGALGGAGLAAALVHEALFDARSADEAPPTEGDRTPGTAAPCVAIAVGPAVVRGLPTAARATVAGAPAPLTGRYADGQVGGELAAQLAKQVDGLVLRGRSRAAGAVLILSEDPAGVRVELAALRDLEGRSPSRTHARLAERFGPCATLAVGPAGERGAPAASLAADGRHFVGRGGLGALLGELGLKAVVVRASPGEQPDPRSSERTLLLRWLGASPRLAVRAAQGSLELFGELAARGEESGNAALANEAEGAGVAREGCRGCPTPCGWVFQTEAGQRPGHFSANRVLGSTLGIEDFASSLELLAACDAAGLDAKEVGPALAAWCAACAAGRLAEPSPRGDLQALRALIHDAGAGRGRAALLAEGARAATAQLARRSEASREEPGSLAPGTAELGAAARGDATDALVARVGVRGGDPMRVFPFLVGSGAGPAALAARVEPLVLPAGADDPERFAGKGRLVWWHESFAAALDANGFCAFSAAGLLVDGIARLDALVARITGEDEAGAGLRFLGGGAALCFLHREIDARLAADPVRARGAAPAGLEAEVAEYARLRGVDLRGRPLPEARERFRAGGDPVDLAALASVEGPALADATASAPGARSRGRVHLRSAGALARALGGRSDVELELPATLREVLAVAGRGHAAGKWLVRDGEPLPSAYREGRRVAPDDLVADGDRLDLVLALRGG